MGILLEDAELLLELRNKNLPLDRVLTLGRQQLFFEPSALSSEMKKARITTEACREFVHATYDRGPAEPLFKALGANEVCSMDHSNYEGATIVHDLNLPLKNDLQQQFDLVYDGGTLEHVFNFPQALKNAMEMVKLGGSLVVVTPANNQFGHGFYQFSPELFYTAFSAANGFEVEAMYALEISPSHSRYTVSNPSVIGSRVTLSNSWPVNLFVHARRNKIVPIFATSPQQSDYSRTWANSKTTQIKTQKPKSSGKLVPLLKQKMRASLPGPVRWISTFNQVFIQKEETFRDERFFKELNKK